MSVFADAQGIAKVTAGRYPRLVKRHAFGVELIGAFCDMEIELASDVAIDAAGAETG